MSLTVFDWYMLNADETNVAEGIQHETLVMPVVDAVDAFPSGRPLHMS